MTLYPSIYRTYRATLALLLACNVVQVAAAESALLTKVRAGDDVKVVLVGTSLTAAGSWPESLQTWLSSESTGPGTVTVVNRAVSGKASNHGVATQTPLALTDNPDAVFIEFSMNDAATSLNITQQQAEDNLNAMLDQFVAQNPNVIIVLQTMNSLPPDTSPFSPRDDLNGYYQIYRDVAVERGAILIDHYPNWLNLYNNDLTTWNSYMKDAVHPNATGEANVLMPELQRVLSAAPDGTAPTLASEDFVDDQSGGPLSTNALVTFTVTFSEDMNSLSVGIDDFSNAGTAAVSISSTQEISAGVFAVEVTPTSFGSLQLQVSAGAVLNDLAGNSLDTTTAILDDTTLTVDSINTLPVWASDPINEVAASEDEPYASTLDNDASDSDDDTLAFAKVNGPDWLNIASNGTLSGTPDSGDVGENSFTVSVTDNIAGPVTATLNITVAAALTPPAGDYIVAWDDFLNLSGSNTAADDVLTGFSGNIVSSRNFANSAYGSTDGTYGSAISGANTTNVRALLPNSGNPSTTVTLTNNTGQDYTIASFHLDFVHRYNSAEEITVTYVSGGLGPAATIIFTTDYNENPGSSSPVTRDLDINLSTSLTDLVLADEETATFTIVLDQFNGTNSTFVDNIAFQAAPPVGLEIVPQLSTFTHDTVTGDCTVTITGEASSSYKLVEADDLDFSNPDQDPIPLDTASIGTLNGDAVVTTAGGNAEVEFNLGTTKTKTFFRAEKLP